MSEQSPPTGQGSPERPPKGLRFRTEGIGMRGDFGNEEDDKKLRRALRRSCIFTSLSNEQLERVIKRMTRIKFSPGDVLERQGDRTKGVHVISSGSVVRRRKGVVGYQVIDEKLPSSVEPNEEVYLIGDSQSLVSFGQLHAFDQSPSFATSTAVTNGVVWLLPGEVLSEFMADPEIARRVASGLAGEMLSMSVQYRTPLLEQPPQYFNWASVSVAAAFEAYYRAAMNGLLNATLVRAEQTTLFPNMHVQIPTRVLYINGFKASRQFLAEAVDNRIDDSMPLYQRQAMLLAPALLPGIIMNPISGVLEACNAGHTNPEPLWRRSLRGFFPRMGREVVFGIGLNQFADYCEERVPDQVDSKILRNAIGSIVAGVVAGYFSHVPHNLSTMKLLQPHISYADHIATLIRKSQDRIPAGTPLANSRFLAAFAAFAMPQGLAIRSTQIVGSFVLLNGISHLLDIQNYGQPPDKPTSPLSRQTSRSVADRYTEES